MSDPTTGSFAVDVDVVAACMPLLDQLGIAITTASADAVEGELTWRPELCTIGGLLHGGVLMALADSLGAVAAFLRLPEGATTATITSHTTLVAAVREGTVRGRAVAEHVGSRFITVRTELHRDDGRLVATTTQTQAVLR